MPDGSGAAASGIGGRSRRVDDLARAAAESARIEAEDEAEDDLARLKALNRSDTVNDTL